MKKTLLIALAGMMMFAFTQCGNKSDKKGEKTEEVKGSQEYKDTYQALNEMTKIVENGKDCDQIEDQIEKIIDKYSEIRYEDNDRMTEEEEEKIEELWDKFEELSEKKSDELGCYDY